MEPSSADADVALPLPDAHGSVALVPVIEIPVSKITDWDTFPDTFAAALGFPAFYGRNMDAWIAA